jgi:hypothetical protein
MLTSLLKTVLELMIALTPWGYLLLITWLIGLDSGFIRVSAKDARLINY